MTQEFSKPTGDCLRESEAANTVVTESVAKKKAFVPELASEGGREVAK